MKLNMFLTYLPKMVEKSKDIRCKFKVVAIGFTCKGNLLGISISGHREGLSHNHGAGQHAEMELMKRYGKRLDKIYIIRLGNSYDFLPIHACENCSKVANKLGIKIISLHEKIKIKEYV